MNKKITYIVLGLLVITGIFGYNFYKNIYGEAVHKNSSLYIKSDTDFKELITLLKPLIDNTSTFEQIAKLKKFSKPKTGFYKLTKGMNYNTLINKLRSGNQSPIKVSFNNQDTLEKLAARIAQQLEADSLSFLTAMREESFLKNNGFTEKTALGMYIPNQYEMYWTASPEKFRNKMLKYYKNFWNPKRVAKAKQLGLTKNQVTTLASIVQKETAQKRERPIVAGLYLNRYQSNWPLQADPTVIYALKELHGHEIIIKRVLNKDLNIDSPYNTYKNTGLPPAPISMPDISSIDAVLTPAKHNYYYMCASTKNIGFHDFAKTLAQHNRNAKKYQDWISKQGIRR